MAEEQPPPGWTEAGWAALQEAKRALGFDDDQLDRRAAKFESNVKQLSELAQAPDAYANYLKSVIGRLRDNRAEMRAALERLRDRYLDEDNTPCAMDLRMLLDAYRLPGDPA